MISFILRLVIRWFVAGVRPNVYDIFLRISLFDGSRSDVIIVSDVQSHKEVVNLTKDTFFVSICDLCVE